MTELSLLYDISMQLWIIFLVLCAILGITLAK